MLTLGKTFLFHLPSEKHRKPFLRKCSGTKGKESDDGEVNDGFAFLLLPFSLEESGQTALGPALLVSIVIGSQCPGSKVILCTDGLANVGVGAVDGEC